MIKKILFIGAGRLGTTLALALYQSEFSIPYFYSKEYPKKEIHFLPQTIFNAELDSKIIQNSDAIIITVPDDQIKYAVKQVSSFNITWHNKLVVHTSGCLSSTELTALKSKGALVGSIHPMQTFGDYFLPKSIFNNIIFAVEGGNQIIAFAEKIVELLNAKIIKLKPEDKTLYHIAAVASSNFFVGLLDYVSALYKKLDFDENKIRDLVQPIVNQTLINYSKNESKDILTGPLKRGDFNTIENHIKYLKNNQKELLPVYTEISKYISQFILEQNESDKEKLIRILSDD